MAVYKNDNEKRLILSCDCGCGESLYINTEFDKDFNEYYMEIGGADFYHEQVSMVKRRLRRAWNGLRGKDKCLTSLILTRKDLQDLTNFLTDTVYEPLEPEEYAEDGWFVCPNCEAEQQFSRVNEHTYCSNCGAHIDDSIWRN